MNNKWPTDEFLARWLNREAEAEEWQGWDDQDSLDDLKRIVQTAENFEVPARKTQVQAWEELQARIAMQDQTVSGPITTAPIRPLYQRQWTWMAAAAIAMLILTVWWNRPQRVITAEHETQIVSLEDGTVIRVNGGSKLTYDEARWEENRQLSLNGEAFFEVAPGDSFRVLTERGIITVLGTEFNVFARGEALMVACYEGKVAVEWEGLSQPKLLTPGKILEKSGANSPIIRKLNGISKPGWLDGRYYFEQAPLNEVIKEISRRYGVAFELDPAVDTEESFTGVFYYQPNQAVDGQLDQALNMVIGTMGYQHRVEGNVVHVFP